MLKEILKDLKQNIKEIYDTDTIFISNFLHHCLSYKEVYSLIKRYYGNPDFMKTELLDHINTNIRSTYSDFHQYTNNFQFTLNGELITDQVIFSDSFNYLYSQIINNEKNLLIRKAQLNNSIPTFDNDCSVESIIYSILKLIKAYDNQRVILEIFKESAFEINEFIKDYENLEIDNNDIIERLCTNINEKSQNFSKIIGRDNEINQTLNILLKARKNNPILHGKAGVGKTAIVEGLAKLIKEKNVPKEFHNAVIYELHTSDLVKGTSYRGTFEQNVSDLLKSFKKRSQRGENIILFIDEIHTIMGAGAAGQGNLDFSNMIKPALARGELKTIGATTTDELFKFIKENPALDRRFIPVKVNEPTVEETKEIIYNSIDYYEKIHNLSYSKKIIDRAINLVDRFVSDKAFPDKAFDLLDYAGAKVKLLGKNEISLDDIEFSLSEQKNIDLEAIKSTGKKIKSIEISLKNKIFGQNHVIKEITPIIEKSLAELNDPNKPYASFLFIGPTGVGKTELSKEISKIMNMSFLRLDMSEFSEKHSISKLIGSPAGYVGYEEGSSLTKFINDNPRSLILLDEIEKSHPDIRKLFLQAMDHGQITDAKGNMINLKNTIIIFTSNSGIKHTNNIGFNNKNNINKSEIKNEFAPEFRGRLSSVLEFKSLEDDSINKIIRQKIKEIQKNRLSKKNIKLNVSENVINYILKSSKKDNLGARSIHNHIEKVIVDPLINNILYGDLKDLKKEKLINYDYKNDIIISY